jgi:C1A family cysteine protease
MFGQHFTQTIQELKKYVIKYGEEPIALYFNAIHWEQHANGNISLSKVVLKTQPPDEFIAGLNDSYSVEFFQETFNSFDNSVSDYFDKLHANTVISGNVGDYRELHFCLYIPLYEPELWEQSKTLINELKSLNRPTHIDVVGFTADLANVIYPDDANNVTRRERELQTKKIAQEIVKYKEENQGNIYHFLVMQNTQTGGVSLNLDTNSFVRIVGEFAVMCVENYQSIFGIVPQESDLQTFGFSELHFDKYYFIEYLLHKAYLYAMDREGVQQEEVDINMAFNKSNAILKDKVSLLSDFIKAEVLPRIEQKQDEMHIVEDLAPLLKSKLNEFDSESNDFINDRQLSIPAKRAILTALLGYDDPLFVNTIFNDNTLLFDDLNTEAMNVFIDANNALLATGTPGTALLSNNNQPVVFPLKDMKKLRTEMQRRMGYIRELELETQELETQIGNISASQKCLIENGFFVLGDNKYRLLPSITEDPLKETYQAHPTTVQSVDLRNYFNNIKNQEQQGSCLAFTLTSIYEYILKSNNVKQIDLSEAFLYYNTRKKTGNEEEDNGSNLQNAIDSLAEYGICLENLCPYDENVFNKKPDENAYADALQRRVKKALNVNGTLHDIKSALSDGHPVAISLKIYPSFGNNSFGFVQLPSEKELANIEAEKNYSHAMVITGFNDENKFFVVRNSWGTSFGDSGYCYVPYSYISDTSLFNWACIISDVDVYSAVTKNPKSTLRFDETDVNIRYAIANNLCNEEKSLLKKNEKEYELLRFEYERLKQLLKNPNTQSQLRQFTKERITKEIETFRQQREQIKEEKYKQLDAFDKRTRKTGIKLSLLAAAVIAIVFLLAYFIGWKFLAQEYAWFREYTWYSFASVVVIVGSLFFYFPYRQKKRKKLEDEFDNELENLAIQKSNKDKELTQTSLKMHVTAHFLTELFKLHIAIIAKYNATSSFLANLQAWYHEENNTIKTLDANTQLPFIPLLKNEVLDTFFEQYKESVTQQISLCKNIAEFSYRIVNDTISKEDLKRYKEDIKKQCINELKDLIEGFNVYSYLCNNIQYDYLDANSVSAILLKLDEKSSIFLCDNGSQVIVPSKFILIHTPTDNDTRQWEQFFPRYFTEQPNAKYFLSPYKVIVFQLADLSLQQFN